MEIRGLANGLGVFYIEARIMYRTKDGYSGTRTFPTFWTVGGTPEDAIRNAADIIDPTENIPHGALYMNASISAVNADPNSEYRMVTHCTLRACNTCGGLETTHEDMAHEWNHTCIDNICREVRD